MLSLRLLTLFACTSFFATEMQNQHAVYHDKIEYPSIDELRDKPLFNYYLKSIFIEGHEVLIPDFIEFVSRFKKSVVYNIHFTVIEWTLSNNYCCVYNYVKALPARILKRSAKKHSLKHLILKGAIKNSDQTLIRHMLPLFSYKELASTRYYSVSILEEAKQNNNIYLLEKIKENYSLKAWFYSALGLAKFIITGLFLMNSKLTINIQTTSY